MGPRGGGSALAAEMAANGRSLSTSGNYKSRPGATMAPQDQREARPGDFMGQGLTPTSVWDSFFHKGDKAATDAGVTPQSAKNDMPNMGSPSDWTAPAAWEPSLTGDASTPDASYLDSISPSAANPDSYVGAAVQSQNGYFSKLGAPIARPQVNTSAMTVPPLPNADAISGQSNGYDQAFGAMPTLPDIPMDFSMDGEL